MNEKPSLNSSRDFVRRVYPHSKVYRVKQPYRRPQYVVFDELSDGVVTLESKVLGEGPNTTKAWITAEKRIKVKMIELLGG